MIQYLDSSQVAERIGVKPNTLSRYNLPEPDAMVGSRRGWLPKTIDVWNESRPGRGRWGSRAKITPKSTVKPIGVFSK